MTTSPRTDVRSAPDDPPLPDRRIARVLWPVLLAAIVSLFPFTVYATFLVAIADSVSTDEAAVGALRGLGGLAALVTGVALAPLLGNWRHHRTVVAGLVLLAASSLVGTLATYPALVLFCLGVGAATAVLTPALLAAAVAAFPRRSDGGRAATLVTATQSLAAVLAGPVIGLMAGWHGWHGALWITAVVTVGVAALFVRRDPARTRPEAAVGYRAAFRRLRAGEHLLALIAIAALRTTSFMGYLAFLAVSYHDRFAMDPWTFTSVWTLSGGCFFVGNYLAGRWSGRSGVAPRALLLAGLVSGLVAVLTVFVVPTLGAALAATALMGFSHAVVAAVVTSLIAQRAGSLAPTAFSVNAAGMSVGVFAGALLGGIGLSVGSGPGLGVALAVPTLVALLLVRRATATANGATSPPGGVEAAAASPRRVGTP